MISTGRERNRRHDADGALVSGAIFWYVIARLSFPRDNRQHPCVALIGPPIGVGAPNSAAVERRR
jgi:hypothetical protein